MVQRVDGARFRPSDLPGGLVPVMFTADWCGHCHRFAPLYKRVAGAWMVDISDDDDPLWDLLSIRVVPTVILFRDGEPVTRWAGALRAPDADAIQAALSGDPSS